MNKSNNQTPKPKVSPKKKSSTLGPANGRPAQKAVSVPVAKGKVVTGSKARMTTAPNGDIRIAHREFVRDISGSVAFTALVLAVNPGLNGSFPWLSTIAKSFESYRFSKLKFCFETEAPTSSTGTVLMAIDYDANDATPTTKIQAMAYRSSVRSPPWSDSCHDSLREDLSKRKTYYVRQGSLTANRDIDLYDTGNLFICTQGQADTSIVGELYVEYDCHLMTPQLGSVQSGESVWGNFRGTSNSNPFSPTLTGNLPATLVSSGTTSSVTTWTFSQPWSGVLALAINGTGITSITSAGSTATMNVQNISIDGAAALSTSYWFVTAVTGQTVVVNCANTTITTGQASFGQGGFI